MKEKTLMNEIETTLYPHLAFIYGEEDAPKITGQLAEILSAFRRQYPQFTNENTQERINEGDSILITYGDMVQEGDAPPLQTLSTFLKEKLWRLRVTE